MTEPSTLDSRGRALRDLRMSVTDSCNFRCGYCMPQSPAKRASSASYLSRVELVTVARAFVALGVNKLRVTGGEPLLRRDLPEIVEELSQLGVSDLCLTTNGSLLEQQARTLANAGLRRVTVSLDSLDESTFQRMSGTLTSVLPVLRGIDAALEAGLRPLKLNMVVRRGINDQDILPMARWAAGRGLTLRFIEYMDVGHSNGWRREEVVPSAEIVERLRPRIALTKISRGVPSETAERYLVGEQGAELGFISSVTDPFCGHCSRARVTAQGMLHTCLFAPAQLALRPLLREPESLIAAVRRLWEERTDNYSERRINNEVAAQSRSAIGQLVALRRRPEMSNIGG